MKQSALDPSIDWEVKEELISLYDGSYAKKYKSLHRDDTGYLLNITKTGYKTATNKLFIDTAHKISDITGFEIKGYQQFDNGKKVLAYLQNPSEISIGGFNSTNYLCMGNSFDYSHGYFTSVVNKVIRCKNVFSRMIKQHSVAHRGNLEVKVQELVRIFEAYTQEESNLTVKYQNWNGIQISQDLVDRFTDHILEIDHTKTISANKVNQKKSLFHSINTEITAMGHNVYGMFNGLTYHTTHVKETSKGKVYGNVLGHAAKMNKLGYEFLEKEYA